MKTFSRDRSPNAKSKYRGVSVRKYDCNSKKPYRAQCCVNMKSIYLGNFKTEIEAAKAYDKYCKENSLNKILNFY
jgi:hypothetical protein